MKNTWFLLIALFGLIAIIIIAIIRSHKYRKASLGQRKDFKPLANTSIVLNLPEYKTAKRNYHLLLLATTILFITIFSTISIIAARPTSVTTAKPAYENRDIMLCLDVSGSMNDYIKQLLEYFSTLLDDFKGQRVGLTIFDSVYLTIAPLSDDYDLLSDIFMDFKEHPDNYTTSLWSEAVNGSSSIGPGLVGCINSFDKLGDQERSRAIILATDNYDVAGKIVTLTQAANYAKRYDIAVYGLSTGEYRTQDEIDKDPNDKYVIDELKEFRDATLSTGGAYYAFSSWGDDNNSISVQDIVQQILAQNAARYEGAETLVYTDNPLIPIIIVAIGLTLFFIIIWRLSL